MNKNIKVFLLHFSIVVGFLVLALIYAKPVLNNKRLFQYDVMQGIAAAKEVKDYEGKTGRYSLWANSMFSGMPAYTVAAEYPNSLTTSLGRFVSYSLPQPVALIFLMLVSFYVLMSVLGFNPGIAVFSSIGFAFSSFHFISIEAGHISKVLAIAYAPLVVAGVILLYRGRYIVGAIVTIIALILQLYANHVQITYYLAMALIIYVVYELVNAILKKQMKQFIIASSIILLISGFALGSMLTRFWTVMEYSNLTMRGGSELKKENEKKLDGLDKEYAYTWSYGVEETLTFLIPNIYGGASGGELDTDSETYKVIKKNYGVKAAKSVIQSMPLYWGSQPNTGGPAYIGAIICFLFVLSYFVVKNSFKWWVLGVVILFTMLSWGKNFEALTNLFYNNVPLYNKFRAVTMIHSLVAMFMCFMAGWGIKEIISVDNKNIKTIKYLQFVAIGFAGFLLIIALMGSSLFSFEKISDDGGDKAFVAQWEQMTNSKEMAESVYEALLEDRASLLQQDAWRSLIFIILSAAILWIYLKKNLSSNYVNYIYVGLILLVLVDMWAVCKRYLNEGDFDSKKNLEANFVASPADVKILEDKDPHFRVYNTTVSAFNDATTSYFHKSIGGYSAAKMSRYQDLIEQHIGKGNMKVINMLNTKYIIQADQQGNPVAFLNQQALGNAWFVDSIRWVNSPDEEIKALNNFNPSKTAVIDVKFKDKVGNVQLKQDSAASIQLTEIKQDHLTYTYSSNTQQLAVFSEIYYNDKLGWVASIDGKEVPHFRVNYLLRGVVLPPGKHKIDFDFHPRSYYTGEGVSLLFSIVLLVGLVGLVVLNARKKNEESKLPLE